MEKPKLEFQIYDWVEDHFIDSTDNEDEEETERREVVYTSKLK